MDERTLDLNFYILAQPKAGSTWLVHLLSSFINKDYKFSELEKYIPIHTGQKELSIPYRIHNPKTKPEGKNILLIRNPFDSIVSWRNYGKLRGYRLKDVKDFSNYYININKKTLIITYENLNLNTYSTLKKILNFLNWEFSELKILEVINKCSLKNLKQYEDITLERKKKFLFYNYKAQLQDKIRFYNVGECYNFNKHLNKGEINNIYNKYKEAINTYWPEIKELIK